MGKDNCMMSEFYCTQCSRRGIPVWRKGGRGRPAGHLKKLWCPHCNKETNNCEIKPNTKYSYEDFLLEFYGNNFDENGNRKLPYGLFKQKLVKEKKLDKLQLDISMKLKNQVEGEIKNE